MSTLAEQYAALTSEAGFVDVSDRTQIEVSGEDRVTFLHNMCTQDIKKLAVGGGAGRGAEAFFTDAKGHVLAFVDLFLTPHSIVIDTVAGQAAAICQHLDKYIIREDVRLTDQSDAWAALLVAGQQAADALANISAAALPCELWQHAATRIAGEQVFVRRGAMVDFASWSLVFPRAHLELIKSALVAAGFVACDAAVCETVRIENGLPAYGRDITHSNLPQEVDRNGTAIRFDKGCYIGQETVARLDALGHVNKRLVRLKFDGTEVPPPCTPLLAGDQTVGTVTSSTHSPRFNAPLAFAYVRHQQSAHGSRLASEFGTGEVI